MMTTMMMMMIVVAMMVLMNASEVNPVKNVSMNERNQAGQVKLAF